MSSRYSFFITLLQMQCQHRLKTSLNSVQESRKLQVKEGQVINPRISFSSFSFPIFFMNKVTEFIIFFKKKKVKI
jgi:hypothetical protein